MAYAGEDLIIITDSDDNEDTDMTHLLYQATPRRQPSSAFNSNAVPIESKYKNSTPIPKNSVGGSLSREPVASMSSPSGTNSVPEMTSISLSDPYTSFVRAESAQNPGHFPDEETLRHNTNHYCGDDVSYRHTEYHFTEHQEELRRRMLQDKKKNIILNMLLISVIGLLQNIGFVHYYSDVLYINTNNVSTQRTATVLLLASTGLSTIGSYAFLQIIGYKWLLFFGCISSALFTCARFFATMPFLLPASILSGVGQGPFVVGLYCYMVHLTYKYSSLSGYEYKPVLYFFTGFLHMWLLSSPAWSILLRYAFLPAEASRSFHDTYSNTKCGHHFCWKSDTNTLGSPVFEMTDVNSRSVTDAFRLQALLGCYLVCSFVGALLSWMHITEESKPTTGLPPLPPSAKNENKSNKNELCCPGQCSKMEFEWNWIFEPLYRFSEVNTLFLVPLFIYLGVQQYLAYSTFNQAFTQCSHNLSHAFGVAATMAASSLVSSLPITCLITHVGKVKVILPALIVQLVVMIVMVTVDEWTLLMYYMTAIFWGIADATIHNIIIVLCVTEFEEDIDSMIGCFRTCQICGYMLMASLQLTQVCTFVTVILAMCILGLALICFISLEIKRRLEEREALKYPGSMYVPLPNEATWLPHVNPVHVRRERTESLNSRIPSVDSD